VRRAHVGRSEQIPFRIEPKRGKVGKTVSEPKSNDPWDIFKEYKSGFDFFEDSRDIGPEPPVVIGSALSAGD